MRCAHIGIVLTLVIGVVAAGYGQALGGGYLIRNASLVLTMDPNLGDGGILGQLEDADVLIVDDQIADVGVNLPKPSGTSVIDGRGMIVMPGFVDTHEHAMQSIIRGCAADDTVVGWLARCTSGIRAANPTESEMYAAARLHTVGLIDSGVTTVNDWIGRFLTPVYRGDVRALVDSKLRFAVAVFGFATDGSDLAATVNMVKQEFIDGEPTGDASDRLLSEPGHRGPRRRSEPARPLARGQASRPLAREHRRPGGEPAPGAPE